VPSADVKSIVARIKCGDELHGIMLTSSGDIVLLDHDAADIASRDALHLLGGEECRCMRARREAIMLARHVAGRQRAIHTVTHPPRSRALPAKLARWILDGNAAKPARPNLGRPIPELFKEGRRWTTEATLETTIDKASGHAVGTTTCVSDPDNECVRSVMPVISYSTMDRVGKRSDFTAIVCTKYAASAKLRCGSRGTYVGMPVFVVSLKRLGAKPPPCRLPHGESASDVRSKIRDACIVIDRGKFIRAIVKLNEERGKPCHVVHVFQDRQWTI
jgi:hypothetical protein